MMKIPGRNIIKHFLSERKSGMDAEKEMKLMLVDDEERFLYAMEKLLTKKGYDIQTASSGEQCLDILSKNRIHVVILDVKMPGLDGLETLRRIKQQYPLVEVILLTGHGTVESAVDGLKCGASDFLMKPISASDLLDRVKDAFARSRSVEAKIDEARSRRFMQQSPSDILNDVDAKE